MLVSSTNPPSVETVGPSALRPFTTSDMPEKIQMADMIAHTTRAAVHFV
jgi:hypothetical protein